MKSQGFGGTQLKDYHGRWWVSRQRMGVNSDQLVQLQINDIVNIINSLTIYKQVSENHY